MFYRVFYTLLLILLFPFVLFVLYRPQKGKKGFGNRWIEHFGLGPKLPVECGAPIWIHAVSVGELTASISLINRLLATYPDQHIVLTTTTSTGAKKAAALGNRVHHRYMPLDYPWSIRAFIRRISPSILLIMETELWPNTLSIASSAGLPVLIVNARLSERSYRRYQWVPGLFRAISSPISHIICQHQGDADRFVRLGIPSNKLSVTGSIKFDLALPDNLMENAARLRAQFPCKSQVWIAASTHKGEDEQVLDAFRLIRETFPESRLILAPRHPQRFIDVYALCHKRGWRVARRSLQESPQDTDVYIGDTMGELLLLLKASDVAFIGGSLVPIGGHNLLEPAGLGIPSITGPYNFNFSDIAASLIACSATQICNTSAELANIVIQLLDNPEERKRRGNAGAQFIASNRGAINSIEKIIAIYLNTLLTREIPMLLVETHLPLH